MAGADAPDASFIEATVAPLDKAFAGLILAYDPTGGLLEISWRPGGKIELSRRSGGAEAGLVLASADGPPGAEAKLRADIAPGGVVKVLLAGKEVLSWTASSPEEMWKGRVGLFTQGGKARFSGVKVPAPKAAR